MEVSPLVVGGRTQTHSPVDERSQPRKCYGPPFCNSAQRDTGGTKRNRYERDGCGVSVTCLGLQAPLPLPALTNPICAPIPEASNLYMGQDMISPGPRLSSETSLEGRREHGRGLGGAFQAESSRVKDSQGTRSL